MKSFISVLFCTVFLFSGTSQASLIISEYVEGSSNNKALEFFNNGSAIDFGVDTYTVEIYTNGSVNPSRSIALTGNIEPMGVYVLAHTRADSGILSAASQTSSALSFNGDDAIVLLHNGLIIDSIGQVGVDPGTEWGSGDNSTQNNTLVRDDSIMVGDKDGYDAFDPATQWMGYSQNNFSFLGAHDASSPVPPAIVKADFVDVPTLGTLFLFVLGLLLLVIHHKMNVSLRSNMAIDH